MDNRGTVLSRSFASRTNLGASIAPALWPGFQIGCYTCHSGPSNDNRNPNGAPTVSGASLVTTTGNSAAIAINARDTDNDPLTLWVVNQPANGTVGMNGATATFIPQPGFEGSDSFTVAAWDGMTSSNLATVQVQVTAPSRPQVAAIVNAASARPGAVAPGELLTIYGNGMGPDAGASMSINSANLVDRLLAGTRVLFDGHPAPVLFASANQVNVVAPWSLAASSKTSVNVRVEYGGIQSAVQPAPIAATSPGIFFNALSGPVTRGTVLTLYVSGGGPQKSPALDGSFSAPLLSSPVADVSVQIGGIDCPLEYAGDAPGLVSGLLQINVRVPATVTPGDAVPLVLKIGNASAPAVFVTVQ